MIHGLLETSLLPLIRSRTIALQAEWAYRQPFTSNDQRAAALDPRLHYYDNERTHHGIGGTTPISRAP